MIGAALVTGAGTRLGRAMATYLATRGFAVAVHYNTSADAANAVVADLTRDGHTVVSIQADLLSESQTQKDARPANHLLGEQRVHF